MYYLLSILYKFTLYIKSRRARHGTVAPRLAYSAEKLSTRASALRCVMRSHARRATRQPAPCVKLGYVHGAEPPPQDDHIGGSPAAVRSHVYTVPVIALEPVVPAFYAAAASPLELC